MQTITEIRSLLAERGFSPRRALGQNFLIDHNLLTKLVEASGVGPGDLVLEVGPGTGTLTEALLDRGCRVIACELDTDLCSLMRDRFGENDNFTLVEGDCLKTKRTLSPDLIEALGDLNKPFHLVANLPYGAATPLLLILMTQFPACRSMFVTIQREVGQRLLAHPGSDQYGSISIVARVTTNMKTIATLSPSCFWPRPQVDSIMLAAVRKDPVAVDLPALADLCQKLFTQRRKQIRRACNNLGLKLPEDVDSSTRVSGLEPETVVRLLQAQ
jgi:16S rRNA (adenine1518-N6/adenine1519-N6)-dimethyltransferase